MPDKFQNKYRIKSARNSNWDYTWNAAYFINICTHNRKHFFGEIKNGEMQLSNVGVIANLLWYEINNHAKNIEIGEFVVMPNHIHGILILDGNDITDKLLANDGIMDGVQTRHALSVRLSQPQTNKSIGQKRLRNPGRNSISSIIGGYKSAVTKHANRLNFEFKWQTRFHDHIIRDDKSFKNISNYIINNPKKWNEDKFYLK